MSERLVKFAGNPLSLAGAEVKVGQRAPGFKLTGNDLGEVTLASTSGKVRVFAAVPSLDTPVCDRETRRFNQDVASLPGAHVYVVSMDLPFAQKRWCGAAGLDKVTTLSDHRSASFGEAWGVLVPSVRLLTRAVFVVDKADQVRLVEYLPDVGQEPNYAATLAAVKTLL
jgi:thioredoxin-dependent peroxiredoxin